MEWLSKVVNQSFGDFANNFLQRFLVVGARFSRIDVVFDNYHELSIIIGGRSKRSKGNDILLKLIFSLSEIKQWGMFSSSNEKKTCLSGFFCRVEKQNCRFTIGHKSIFVTDGENVFRINNHNEEQSRGWCCHKDDVTRSAFQPTLPKNFDFKSWHRMFSSFVYHLNLPSMQIYIFSQGWETLDELSTSGAS